MNNMKLTAWASCILVAIAVDSLAANNVTEASDRQNNSFFTLTVDNDSLAAGTDKYYTSGVRISYHNSDSAQHNLVRRVMDAIPLFTVNETARPYYVFGQNLYTPRIISTTTPDQDDRPYAAFLYAATGYTNPYENYIDDIRLTLGVVGPAALGEQTQRYIHRLTDSLTGGSAARGWNGQLRNEPGLILSWQRTWPEINSTNLDSLYLRVAPYTGLTLGNIYTYASTGVMLQLMPAKHKWHSIPAGVWPANSGYSQPPPPVREFSWSIFTRVEGRAVARNIFLDGNTFTDSPSVDKKHGVLDISTGFAIIYDSIQTTYTINWRSKEFHNQDKGFLFGSVVLGYRF